MIIDADTHISPTGEFNTIKAEELIARMDISGVDKAVCWLQPPYMREIDDSLDYVYKATMKYPDRLLGFGWTDPHLGIQKAIELVKRCTEKYGFYGVKMNGAQNAYYIDDEKFSMPIIEEIAKTGKILALHIGADEYDFTHPYRMEKIAKCFPKLQILAVHMGGAGLPNLSKACIEVAIRNQNIHLIGSAVGWNSIIAGIRELGAERISFGSDTPFSDMHADVCAYKAFLGDKFTPEEAKLIMGGNIERLFGLK